MGWCGGSQLRTNTSRRGWSFRPAWRWVVGVVVVVVVGLTAASAVKIGLRAASWAGVGLPASWEVKLPLPSSQ